MDLKRELDAMGGPAANSRGEMIHLILTLCRKFETSFAKLIDGGKGGERGTRTCKPAVKCTSMHKAGERVSLPLSCWAWAWIHIFCLPTYTAAAPVTNPAALHPTIPQAAS